MERRKRNELREKRFRVGREKTEHAGKRDWSRRKRTEVGEKGLR